MWIGKLLAIGALGVTSIHAQMTNTTILGILNTTQLSPAYKFVQLLTSNATYQPILDLLSGPGNITVFVPSDQVFEQLQSNMTSGSSSGDSNANSSSSTSQGSSAMAMLQQQSGNNNSSSSNGGNATVNPFTQGSLQNYSVLDVIQYHIVNGSYDLKDLNQSSVLHTLLTNRTLDKNGLGMPVVVQNNGTTNNNSSSSSGGNSNSTSSQYVIGEHGYVMAAQSNGTTTTQGGNNSTSQNNTVVSYTVGNGNTFANVTLYDIRAANGVLHIINNVLIPPGKPSEVVQNVSQISTLGKLSKQFPNVTNAIDNAVNITVFAPINKALQSMNTSNGMKMLKVVLHQFQQQQQQQQAQQLIQNYIVQGVYYADNLTQLATQNTQVQTVGGSPLTFTPLNQTIVRVNNTATVVKPNILLDNGVMHLIDHVLTPPQQGGQGGQAGGGQQGGQGGGQPSGQAGAQPSSP